jgi:heme exporter protein B
MLLPVERSTIYLGKFLGNVLFMLIAEALILPIFSVLFDLSILHPLLWLVVALGTVGLAAAGTFLAAMAVNTRAREIMLPILLFPVTVPVMIAATKATGQILDGRPVAELYAWLRLLLAFNLVFTLLAFLGFEYVLEE